MNNIDLVNLLENHKEITTVTVKFLRITQSVTYTTYTYVGDIFYFYKDRELDGVCVDLKHYQEHTIKGHVLEITISMLYQEKFIQLFHSELGHYGQVSCSGMLAVMRKFHTLDAFEITIDGQTISLHETQMRMNHARIAIVDTNDIPIKFIPMYTIQELTLLDYTKLTINTYGNMYKDF